MDNDDIQHLFEVKGLYNYTKILFIITLTLIKLHNKNSIMYILPYYYDEIYQSKIRVHSNI